MEKIYIVLVSTPGIFAFLIKQVIKQKYIHVSLALDDKLETTYSVGRRHPSVPWFSGFTRERFEQVLEKFPDAQYRIMEMEVTKEQKAAIKSELEMIYEKRKSIHYTIIGLPFILWNKPFYQRNHYTCSSFLAKFLSENGITLFQKHFSLVTPKDFLELRNTNLIYEGYLRDYINLNYKKLVVN